MFASPPATAALNLAYLTNRDAALPLGPPGRDIQMNSWHATMQPFAVECWVRMPDLDKAGANIAIAPGSAKQMLLDIGAGTVLRRRRTRRASTSNTQRGTGCA